MVCAYFFIFMNKGRHFIPKSQILSFATASIIACGSLVAFQTFRNFETLWNSYKLHHRPRSSHRPFSIYIIWAKWGRNSDCGTYNVKILGCRCQCLHWQRQQDAYSMTNNIFYTVVSVLIDNNVSKNYFYFCRDRAMPCPYKK